MISQLIIDAVKQISIIDLLNYYDINVPPSSKIKCISPQHNDRTPSFHVYEDDNVGFCFGKCNKSFDVIEVVRALENKGFEDAVMFLYKKFNVLKYIKQETKKQDLTLYKSLGQDFRKVFMKVKDDEKKKMQVLRIFQTIDMHAEHRLIVLKLYRSLLRIAGIK